MQIIIWGADQQVTAVNTPLLNLPIPNLSEMVQLRDQVADDAQAAADSAATVAGMQGDIDQAVVESQAAAAIALDADAKATEALAVQARRDFGKWHLTDYLHPDDMAAALAGNVAGQDEIRVTAAIQKMHDDAIDWWLGGGPRTIETVYPPATLAINDELFSEYFAQRLWDAPSGDVKWQMKMDQTTFQVRNWLAVHRVRTSGFWAAHGITDSVPAWVLRWERPFASGLVPNISGKWVIRGSGSSAYNVDPCGVKIHNATAAFWDQCQVTGLRNVQFQASTLFNSDIANLDLSWGGATPTDFGGVNGLMPSGVTFTNTGAVVTASQAVFEAHHVGKWFCLGEVGPVQGGGGRLNHWAQIASVDSPTQVTLDDPPATNGITSRGSFEAIRANVIAGSNVITLSASLSQSQVGRYIFIGNTRHVGQPSEHFGFVANVVAHSGNQITLSHEVEVTATDCPVALSFTCLLGPTAYDGYSDYTDDVTFGNLRIETSKWHHGNVPLISTMSSGVDFGAGSKLHGNNGAYNNFAGNFCNSIHVATRQLYWVGIDTHGGHSPRFGKHLILGSENNVDMRGKSVGYTDSNKTAVFYVNPPASTQGVLIYYDMHEQSSLWPQLDQVFARYGTFGTPSMIRSGASIRKRLANQPDVVPTYLGDLYAKNLLGDAVTSGQTGYSDDRVMLVGFGGNTGGVRPDISSDLDDALGQHRRIRTNEWTANKPDSDDYIVDVIINTTGTAYQIAYCTNNTNKIAVRNNMQGSWTPWRWIQHVRSGGTVGRPENPYPWQSYCDTTLGKPIWWNGTAWVDATGNTV